MRHKLAVVLVSASSLCLVLAPSPSEGQFKGKGSKGGIPGGFERGPGGFGPGSFGGFGGGAFGSRDPNQMFDFLAKGRGYFLVTDTNRLREPLTQYLQERGITNGQVTRELFAAYNEKVQSSMAGGGPGGFAPKVMSMQGSGGASSFGMGGMGQGGNPLDTLNQLAETEFKIRDRNGDGWLNQDEMPDQLKSELSKWDNSRDNLIGLDEFKIYYVARMQSRGRGPNGQSANPVTIILEEEDIETRPVVFRAGKLPTKELPSWFMELDTDKDGQVGLYEWRKGGKDMDDFGDWDRNNDGLLSAEEALYKQKLLQIASGGSKSEDEGPANSFAARFGQGSKKGFGAPGSSRGESGGQNGEDRGKKKKGSGFQFKRPQ